MIRTKVQEANENIEVVEILAMQENKERKDIILLAIVKWFDNKPVLEKRRWYYDKEDNLKTGKVLALKGEDLDTIFSNYPNLNKHLELTVEPK